MTRISASNRPRDVLLRSRRYGADLAGIPEIASAVAVHPGQGAGGASRASRPGRGRKGVEPELFSQYADLDALMYAGGLDLSVRNQMPACCFPIR
jgi:hypothetical protein